MHLEQGEDDVTRTQDACPKGCWGCGLNDCGFQGSTQMLSWYGRYKMGTTVSVSIAQCPFLWPIPVPFVVVISVDSKILLPLPQLLNVSVSVWLIVRMIL